MYILRKKYWQRPPAYPIEVDWNHFLAPTIDAHIILCLGPEVYDLTSFKKLTLNAPVSVVERNRVPTINFPGSGSNSAVITGSKHTSQMTIVTSFYAESYPNSFPRLMSKDADTAFLMLAEDGTSSYDNDVGFQISWDTGLQSWLTRSENKPAPLFTNLNVAMSYDGSSSANDPIILVNGQRKNFDYVGAPRGTTMTNNAGDIYLGNRSSSARQFDGSMSYFLFSYRAESEQYLKELSKNPWQIFKPHVQRTYVLFTADSNPTLAIADATHAVTSDNIQYVVEIDLSINDSSHAVTSPQISVNSDIELTVADATHQVTSDVVNLVYNITLSADDATHAHSAESPTLVYNVNLTIADTAHALASDNISFSSDIDLTIQATTHPVTSDNVPITVDYDLAISSTVHTVTSDNVSVTNDAYLGVTDATHALTSDNIQLGYTANLSVDDTVHTLTSDNIQTVYTSDLNVNSANHTLTSENIVLTSETVLTISDSIHALRSDEFTLGYVANLSIADSGHIVSSDEVAYIVFYNLLVENASHALINDDPFGSVVIAQFELAVDTMSNIQLETEIQSVLQLECDLESIQWQQILL